MTVGFDVKISGPVFTKGADEVRKGLEDAVWEAVLLGEREATQMAQPAPSGLFHTREYAAAHGYFQTGHYNRSINGRMVSSLHGVVTDSNVVYGPWLEGVSSRNAATRFKGVAIFRKSREIVQKNAKKILEKHVGKIAQRLG